MSRIASIDYIKVLCIMLMVLCHYTLKNEFIVQIIYGFHMPMLFMVSGYLFRRRDITSEIKSFGVPILVFSTIGITWGLIVNTFHTNSESVFEYLHKCIPAIFFTNHGEYHTPFTGLWFIIGLLCTRILFHYINIKKYGNILSIISVIIIEANNQLDLSITLRENNLLRVLQIIPFFYFGDVIREKKCHVGKTLAWILLFFYLMVCITNGRVEMYEGVFGKYYILCLLSVTALFLSLLKLLDLPSNSIIKLYSTGTFLILGTHIIRYLSKNQTVSQHNLIVIIFFLLYFLFILPIIHFVNNHCPIIMGKLRKV